jgi:hypothetical protein
VYLHKDKSIFKLEELPVERYAESLGLPGMPKIKFLSKEIAKKKNASGSIPEARAAEEEEPTADESEDDERSTSEGDGKSDSEDNEVTTSAKLSKVQGRNSCFTAIKLTFSLVSRPTFEQSTTGCSNGRTKMSFQNPIAN